MALGVALASAASAKAKGTSHWLRSMPTHGRLPVVNVLLADAGLGELLAVRATHDTLQQGWVHKRIASQGLAGKLHVRGQDGGR